MAVLQPAVPILLVIDVSRAAAFFRDGLGFAVDFLYGEPPFYGAVSRDAACLHLRFVAEPPFAAAAAREVSLIAATIEVDDVMALHAEFVGRGVAFGQAPTKQVWGGVDFHVADPDGNVVSFVTYG